MTPTPIGAYLALLAIMGVAVWVLAYMPDRL